MTRQLISNLVASFGLPFAYYSFPIQQSPDLPFIVYFYEADDDVIADNNNFVKVDNLRIELYTEKPDFSLIDQIDAQIPFSHSRETVYIQAEQMFQTIFESEVIING